MSAWIANLALICLGIFAAFWTYHVGYANGKDDGARKAARAFREAEGD